METDKKPKKSRKKNITSEEIVERHLHDPRDVITTEDIQNVKVPPTEEEDTIPENTESEEKKEEKGESVPEKEIITPWDVIDP